MLVKNALTYYGRKVIMAMIPNTKRDYTLMVGSSLELKYQSIANVNVSEKHSSLLLG
jgi:hypothetical protein